MWVMVIFRWLFFNLKYRSHSYRWAAVVPRLNYSWTVGLIRPSRKLSKLNEADMQDTAEEVGLNL